MSSTPRMLLSMHRQRQVDRLRDRLAITTEAIVVTSARVV
jgi:hypothetical protein